MVRAILREIDPKTQTRRAIKWPFERWPKLEEVDNLGDVESLWVRGKKITCPYGLAGDRLWVRETLRLYNNYAVPFPTPKFTEWKKQRIWDYAATGKPGQTRELPSIFMPRWASRITLDLTGVRVERVQEISEEDAKVEGITAPMYPPRKGGPSYRLAYRCLWDHLNAKRGFGWDKNPWVWVLEFKRA
jgi:hypothetical protein